MKSKYIEYLKELNISEVNSILNKLELNLISFDELESEVLKHGGYTLRTFEKEQKLQEMLGEKN